MLLDNNPDFSELAKVLGIRGRQVKKPDEVADALKELAESREAMLLHVIVKEEENVFPMVAAGASLNDTRTS